MDAGDDVDRLMAELGRPDERMRADRPDADWSQGLSAADADAMNLEGFLLRVFEVRRNGRDMPAALRAQVRDLVGKLTGEPPREPEYGPGLWSKMPQRSMASMAEARPLDWTGAPSRGEIDLAMLHAIRYGEWLCRTYPVWSQTLPACWPEHDDVVQEVLALKAYADLVAASPNGGFYAPTLQSLHWQALERIREYLRACGEGADRHAHHGSDPRSMERRRERREEYAAWFDRRGAWADEPPIAFADRVDGGFVDDVLLRYGAPPRPARGDGTGERGRLERLRERSLALHERLDAGGDGRLATDAGTLRRDAAAAWADRSERDAAADDRLDAALAAVDARYDGMPPEDLRADTDRARRILDDRRRGDDARRWPLGAREGLADRLERAVGGARDDLAEADVMIGRLSRALDGEETGDGPVRAA